MAQSKKGAFGRTALAGILCIAFVSPAIASTTGEFLRGLWPEAQARGVSRDLFDRSFAGFQPSARIMELTRRQPEFAQGVGAYFSTRVTDAQIATGRRQAGEWSQTLERIEAEYGVPSTLVLAIWGMETNFGGYMGGNNTIHALATLTSGGYRADFYRRELLTALEILSDGDVAPEDMTGSWAGAMGHTQFMPSSFVRYAVDLNRDGRRDIWNSVPDALGSAANYLRGHGWRPGETWGYEISLPAGFDFAMAWSMRTASLAQWQALGVTRPSGLPFPRLSDQARFYLPAGGRGPAFLLLPNFDVIKAYNNSDSYALAVGHLADRILGTGGFSRPWPSNDSPLTRSQRKEMQTLLAQRGYDVGTVDGIVGSRTRAAIIDFQRRNGWFADGYPTLPLLEALR